MDRGGVGLPVNSRYNNRKWERKRAAILARDGYMCRESRRFGKIVKADTVHHIFPVEFFPQYMWAGWNLISLSREQHNAMHERQTHRLTAKGKELMMRTARKYNIDIPPGWDE